MSRIRIEARACAARRRRYGQMGGIVAALALPVLTMLDWRFASVGALHWFFADALFALLGAWAGVIVFDHHHEEA